ATAAERTDLSRVPDAELSIPRHPAKCADGLTKIDLPADCDLFGGDFGGKSRNCPYWWLGRKCYVFYLPERIYREPELRAPILQALERPCDFLFDPAFAADGTEETIRKFDRRARNAFGCNGQLLPLQQEVKVYVIDENDRYTVETVVMKL
ncbi:MAG: hypothetical protein KDJ16_18415, partial [Hyphomicrobiales bacterium]|nr:hypothetical protein [Hyphomicrobiales bacterium]